MGLFYNDYQKLVQENNDAIAKISEKSWETLSKMFEYMSGFQISLFESEVIKKDLIGAAQEADLEEIDFKEKLGMPEKEFCDSLVRAGMEHKWKEHAILMIKDLVANFFGFYVFFWVIDGIPQNYGLSMDLLFLVLWSFVWEYILKYGVEKFVIYSSSERRKRWMKGGRMGVIIVGIMIFIIMPFDCFLVRGNGVVLFMILLLLFAVVFFGNNYYWNKCSKKYNWK